MVRLIVLLAIGLLAVAGGCSSERAAQPPPPTTITETSTTTVTETVAPPHSSADDYSVAASLESLSGEYATVEYPASWTVETAEAWKGGADGYFDTTLRSDLDPNVMVRIDVTPEAFSEPAEAGAGVEAYLRRQPAYERLAFESTSFLGYDACVWEFVVEQDDVLLRKADVFFTTENGDSYAVLIQAPADDYRSRLAVLEAVRESVTLPGTAIDVDESYSADSLADEAGFCATHECIDNFDEGVGSIVQCADGMWSRSGGRQGACSHHGGVAGGSGSGYSSGSSDYDTNGDGSAYNWCGASRDGDGDGLWCEGR